MVAAKLPVGFTLLVLGLAVGLAGSLVDNLVGGGLLVTLLQVVLWSAGGVMALAGAASAVTLRTGQRAGRARLHPST